MDADAPAALRHSIAQWEGVVAGEQSGEIAVGGLRHRFLDIQYCCEGCPVKATHRQTALRQFSARCMAEAP